MSNVLLTKKCNPHNCEKYSLIAKIVSIAAVAAIVSVGCSQYKKTTVVGNGSSSSASQGISKKAAKPKSVKSASSKAIKHTYKGSDSEDSDNGYANASEQNGYGETGSNSNNQNNPYISVSNGQNSLKYAKPNAKTHTKGKRTGTSSARSSQSSSAPAFSVDTSNLPCRNADSYLLIKTYDGSDQAMHPKVLYFKNGWNGWKYWMSYTSYPHSNAKYENPSIAVSQDGISWQTPDGLTNPVIKAPADVNKGGYNSDPELVMNGKTMQLWYRNNPANKAGNGVDLSQNRIYMISSTNGTKWSAPQLELNGNYRYYSPAVLYDEGKYKVWFSNDNGDILYTESADLKNWSSPVVTELRAPNWNAWHQDIIKTNGQYKIVYSAYNTTNKDARGNVRHDYQCLFYAVSDDGIHFNAPVMILAPSKSSTAYDNKLLYRSTLVEVGQSYYLYYSGMNVKKVWHTFRTDFDLNNVQTTEI